MSTLRVDNITDLGDDPVVTGGRFASDVLPAGSVLQVVSTTKTDTFSTTSTSFVDVTAFSASITPVSVSSKILVLFNVAYGNSSATHSIKFNLLRDSTEIAQPDSGGVSASLNTYTSSATARDSGSFTFLDSPSSTSSVTYKIQARVTGATGYVNTGATDNRSISTITLMEVAG